MGGLTVTLGESPGGKPWGKALGESSGGKPWGKALGESTGKNRLNSIIKYERNR